MEPKKFMVMQRLMVCLKISLYMCIMLLTSCGTMKIVCIDVNDCTHRTVTLHHPQNQPVASDTNWRGQRLINVNEENGEFFTITNSKDHMSCYVNVYSPEGVFQRQYKCPYFHSWASDMEMFGDELLTGEEFAGGNLGIFVGALLGPQFLRPQVVSYNIKTKQRKIICPNTSDNTEIYMVKKFNSEIAIIQIGHSFTYNAQNGKNIANNDKAAIAIYHLFTKQLLYIQFPENTYPTLLTGICPNESLFWIRANEEDSDGRFIAEHLFEISLDGKLTDITYILKNEDIIGKKHVSRIIAKERSSGEYIYACSETQKAPERFNRDKAYLCRFSCDSDKKQEAILKLGTKNEGIFALRERVMNGKIGLVLTTDMRPSHYWEYFLFPPKAQYQIYDRNLNLLKSFPLPRRSTSRLQVGHVFYQAYE